MSGYDDSKSRHQMLSNISYEILPMNDIFEKVLAHVPVDRRLSVTSTAAKGLDRTLALAGDLTGAGYCAAPHIAARLVRDDAHLDDIVAQLHDQSVREIFVIAGDSPEPVGPFSDSKSLLVTMRQRGHDFANIGVSGYPDGHGLIDDQLINDSLVDKAPFASYIVTQMCFSATKTNSWAQRVYSAGIDLPVLVGLPGSVNRQKLIRIAGHLGLGPSARFLKKQGNLMWRLIMPGGYRPDRLADHVARGMGSSCSAISGFHIFTFNEVEATEKWRLEWINSLAESSHWRHHHASSHPPLSGETEQ